MELWEKEHLDLVLVPLGLLLMFGYHLVLVYRYLKYPQNTVIGYENHNKRAWVRKMFQVMFVSSSKPSFPPFEKIMLTILSWFLRSRSRTEGPRYRCWAPMRVRQYRSRRYPWSWAHWSGHGLGARPWISSPVGLSTGAEIRPWSTSSTFLCWHAFWWRLDALYRRRGTSFMLTSLLACRITISRYIASRRRWSEGAIFGWWAYGRSISLRISCCGYSGQSRCSLARWQWWWCWSVSTSILPLCITTSNEHRNTARRELKSKKFLQRTIIEPKAGPPCKRGSLT